VLIHSPGRSNSGLEEPPVKRKRELEEPEPIKKEWGSQCTNTYEKEKSQMANDYDYGYDYSDEISL
jgi:hypothetical protein